MTDREQVISWHCVGFGNADLLDACFVDQARHIKIIRKLQKTIDGLKKSREVALTTHNNLTTDLNKAILLLKDNGLLNEYYN